MKKRNVRQLMVYGLLLVCMLLSLTGCKNGKDGMEEEDSQTEQDTGAEGKEASLFLVVANDTLEEGITLYSYATGLEHYYAYSFSTQFKDKYGNFAPAAEFTPGRVVTIGTQDKDGYLTEVQLAPEVWEYEDVRRFSVEENGVLFIADTKYSIRDKVYVFSNGERVSLANISEEDILTVIGKDRKILSIVVTTGHGTLSLTNTTLFEGSYLQLNKDIFVLISDSMEMEIPEGSYTLKVANDGWGGTTEIEVVRGETTEVDLDTLKGEGKKRGIVRFEIDVDDVEVYIDREKVDHTQPVELTYGTHLLQIEAAGYDTWKKYLSVNSEDATISIELSEDEETQTEETETEESETEESETEGVEETETQELSTEESTEETNP